jgi:aspartate kinase
VASERDVLVLEAQADPDELLAALDAHHVSGKQLHVSTGAHTTLVISRDNLHDQDRVTLSLKSQFGDRLELVDDLGAVSAIGAGINATYANIRTGLTALQEAGIAARGMSTSSFRITWMVPDDQVVPAVRALHARFIAASASPVP